MEIYKNLFSALDAAVSHPKRKTLFVLHRNDTDKDLIKILLSREQSEKVPVI